MYHYVRRYKILSKIYNNFYYARGKYEFNIFYLHAGARAVCDSCVRGGAHSDSLGHWGWGEDRAVPGGLFSYQLAGGSPSVESGVEVITLKPFSARMRAAILLRCPLRQ